MQLKKIPIKKLQVVDPDPARINPKNQSLRELADSIKAHGILQPIIVAPAPNDPDRLNIVAGRRRHAAAALAGLEEIPCIVTSANDQAAAEISVVENLQREDLAPLEEASEIQKLIDRGWEIQDIADHIGKSPTWVVRRGNLTNLSKEWQKALGDPKHRMHSAIARWPAGWLELVARCSEEEQLDILVDSWDIEVREDLERRTAGDHLLIAKAPWKTDDATLIPEAGSCDVCPKRSSHRPGLFDDWGLEPAQIKKTDKCLDPKCWEKKAEVHVERKEVELREKHGDVVRVKESSYSGPKDAVGQGDIKKMKAKAEGAKPCIMVDGPKAGQVFYGKPQDWATSSRGGSTTPGRKKGTPTPLKERRAQLAKRREALVNRWLREKLQDKDYPEMAVGRYGTEVLLLHLEAFGTLKNKKNLFEDRYNGGSPWAGKTRLSEPPPKKEECEEKLWKSIFAVMESRLHYHWDPPAKEHELLCKHHGDLFNVTIQELREKAAKEIPEPKSWAGINADGTPKKANKLRKAIRKACEQKPAKSARKKK